MLDFIVLFNTLVESAKQLRRPAGRLLAQPVLTAALIMALYAGYHVVHEGDFADGVRVAFLETNESRANRLRERQDAILQAELRHMSESNKVIDRLLELLLERAPTLARARLDVIHNGITGVTGMGLLRYDVTNSVAGAGHAAGALVQNRPLTEWADFLPDMLAGQCRLHDTGVLASSAIRARLEAMNAGTLLVCPVTDVRGRLLGAAFLLWDVGTRVPEGESLDALMALGQRIGTQIATVLDLRLPSLSSTD